MYMYIVNSEKKFFLKIFAQLYRNVFSYNGGPFRYTGTHMYFDLSKDDHLEYKD